MSIRRWFNGIFRPDEIETDKATVNGTTTTDALNADGVKRGNNEERIDASAFDGADADSRLDSALSSASAGNKIFLENATYSDNRTISTNGLTLTGLGTGPNNAGTLIDGTWTLSAREQEVKECRIENGQVIIDSFALLRVQDCSNGDVIVKSQGSGTDERAMIIGCANVSVTFNANTSLCLIDSCVDSTVTDNGTNTVGDIT